MKVRMAQAPAARAELPRPRRLLREMGGRSGVEVDPQGAGADELPY